MLWLVNTFLMLAVLLLLTERLVGLQLVVQSAVYAGEPRGRMISIRVEHRALA